MRALLLGVLFICLPLHANESVPKNLDFSQQHAGKPDGWLISGAEAVLSEQQLETGTVTAVTLNRTDLSDGEFADISQMVRFGYGGKTLELSAWFSTELVNTDGNAGLWLGQLSEAGEWTQFDDMEAQAINGSTGWKQYNLRVELHPDTEYLQFGFSQTGNGSSTLAQVSLTLDGKAVELAPMKRNFAADQPHEFERDSGIRLTTLSDAQRTNLLALAKVWGFIKYYHPQSAAGVISMDAELFRLMPKLLNATPQARDAVLVSWINTLSDIKPCTHCKDTSSAELAHAKDHWLQWQLSPELNTVLAKVYAAELPAKHYWVKPGPVPAPVFNEKPYADVPTEDTGFRLLAVFRFWNMIHYYSPYRHLTAQPWSSQLETAISSVVGASNEQDYLLALAQLVGAVKDSHTQLNVKGAQLRRYIGDYAAPALVRFVEGVPVVYKLQAEHTGLQAGDVLTQINGKPVAERIAKLKAMFTGSNDAAQFATLAQFLLWDSAEQITVEIKRNNNLLSLTVPMRPFKAAQLEYAYHSHGEHGYHLRNDNIGYIRLDKMAGVDVDSMMAELANTKGLIIDIRNYPSQFLAFSLGKHLHSKPVEFVRFTQMTPANPGQFDWTEPFQVGEVNPRYYKGKVVILINEKSQSQAEYTTMAFRSSPNATVMGSHSAGADGDISQITLPGGMSTTISGLGVYYPDGTATQQIGLVPDIAVKPTIAGIRDGRDEVLEQAVSYINQGSSTTTAKASD